MRITAAEAASILGVSQRAIYDLAAPRGPIPCYRMGRKCIRFDSSDINAYADACKIVQFHPVKEVGQVQLKNTRLHISSTGDDALKFFRSLGIEPPKRPVIKVKK